MLFFQTHQDGQLKEHLCTAIIRFYGNREIQSTMILAQASQESVMLFPLLDYLFQQLLPVYHN